MRALSEADPSARLRVGLGGRPPRVAIGIPSVKGISWPRLFEALPRRKAPQAALDLALELKTWQSLRRSGLSNHTAAEAMVRAMQAQ